MFKTIIALSLLACSVIALDESQAIAEARQLNGVPQVINSYIKGNNYTNDAVYEFNKVFALAKTNTVEGIHNDVINRMSDKFGGFWGGLVALTENTEFRKFYFGAEFDKSSEPDQFHIVMHKGSVALYVYHIKL